MATTMVAMPRAPPSTAPPIRSTDFWTIAPRLVWLTRTAVTPAVTSAPQPSAYMRT
jgi:hypothetical protein